MDSCFDSGDRKMYEYVQAFTKTMSCTEEVANLVTGLDGFQTGRVPYRCEHMAILCLGSADLLPPRCKAGYQIGGIDFACMG